MSAKKLKTAILGLDEKARQLLKASQETNLFDICAVADSQDAALADQIAERLGCTAFDDYRQLVIQSQIDVLFVAEPLHVCQEYLYTAITKNINILKVIPPALDFEQLAEFTRLARKNGVKFEVASNGQFLPGFSKLREYIQTQGVEGFQLITAERNTPQEFDEDEVRWLSDPKLAGGGALLRNCYELIGQIVRNFGLPQQVYSLNTNHAPDMQQRLSLTEDTAIVTMKFSDILFGNLIANRIFGPERNSIQLYSSQKHITVTENKLAISDNLGNVVEEFSGKTEANTATAKMLEKFAAGILAPDKKDESSQENIDLEIMAMIESAYLSARTAMPEEPARILDRAGT